MSSDTVGFAIFHVVLLYAEFFSHCLKNSCVLFSFEGLMVRCPDGNECSDLGACCEISPDSYGCCPFSDGVCCKDHGTCCPATYMCLPGGWCQPVCAKYIINLSLRVIDHLY